MLIDNSEIAALFDKWGAVPRIGAIIAANLGRWSTVREAARAHPCCVPGVWLDATRPDPVAVLLRSGKAPPKGGWRKLRSKSGWIFGKTRKASGSRDLVL